MTEPERGPEREVDGRRLTVAILAALIVLAFIAFVAQNQEAVVVEFLNITVEMPRWFLVLIAMAAGAVLWGSLSWIRRLRKRAGYVR